MSGYRTFLSWYVRKASGFILKVLKLSDSWSWALIYVWAVIAKALRWFDLGYFELGLGLSLAKLFRIHITEPEKIQIFLHFKNLKIGRK